MNQLECTISALLLILVPFTRLVVFFTPIFTVDITHNIFLIFALIWIFGELRKHCAKIWNLWVKIHGAIDCQSWPLLTPYYIEKLLKHPSTSTITTFSQSPVSGGSGNPIQRLQNRTEIFGWRNCPFITAPCNQSIRVQSQFGCEAQNRKGTKIGHFPQ